MAWRQQFRPAGAAPEYGNPGQAGMSPAGAQLI
jgi:hypothetical protein